MEQRVKNESQQLVGKGRKLVDRYNRTHKLAELDVGEVILLKCNPVSKCADNSRKILQIIQRAFVLQK